STGKGRLQRGGNLRNTGGAGRAAGGRPAAAGLRRERQVRWVCQPGSVSSQGERCRGDGGGGKATVGVAGAPQRDDQGACHGGRADRAARAAGRRDKRECDTVVLGRTLPRGTAVASRGYRGRNRRR